MTCLTLLAMPVTAYSQSRVNISARIGPTGDLAKDRQILDYLGRTFSPTAIPVQAGDDVRRLLRSVCGNANEPLLERTKALNNVSRFPLVDTPQTVTIPPCPYWTTQPELVNVPSGNTVGDLLALKVGVVGRKTMQQTAAVNPSMKGVLHKVAENQTVVVPYVTRPVGFTLKQGLEGNVSAVLEEFRRVTNATPVKEWDGFSLVRPIELMTSPVLTTCKAGSLPEWPLDQRALQQTLTRNSKLDVDAPRKAIIAIGDTGVDVSDDRFAKAWNEDERRGFPDIDDDANGYVDDLFGANMNTDAFDSSPAVARGFDFSDHGIHVAGLAQGGDLPPDVARMIRQRVELKVLNLVRIERTVGRPPTARILESAVTSAVAYVASPSSSAQILNLSLGQDASMTSVETALKSATSLIVVAAGNRGADVDVDPVYPAWYRRAYPSKVITVAAHDSDGRLLPESNRGRQTVDLAAPGCRVRSMTFDGAWKEYSGSSQAAPLVSFVAGLLYSYGLPLTQVKQRIFETVDLSTELRDVVASGGRLNAVKALMLFEDVVQVRRNGQPVLISGRILEPADLIVDGRRVSWREVRRLIPSYAPESDRPSRLSLAVAGGFTDLRQWKASFGSLVIQPTEGEAAIRMPLDEIEDIVPASRPARPR